MCLWKCRCLIYYLDMLFDIMMVNFYVLGLILCQLDDGDLVCWKFTSSSIQWSLLHVASIAAMYFASLDDNAMVDHFSLIQEIPLYPRLNAYFVADFLLSLELAQLTSTYLLKLDVIVQNFIVPTIYMRTLFIAFQHIIFVEFINLDKYISISFYWETSTFQHWEHSHSNEQVGIGKVSDGNIYKPPMFPISYA